MAAKAEKPEKAWIASRAGALAKIPGKHMHPTLPGFSMRVSPKCKAVWAWRITDALGKKQSGKFGEVAEAGKKGLCLDEAVELFEKKLRTLKSATVSSEITLQDAFDDLMTGGRRGGGKRSESTDQNYNRVFNSRLKGSAGQQLARTNGAHWNKLLTAVKAISPADARIAFWILHATYGRFVDLGVLSQNALANRTMKSAFSGRDSTNERTTYLSAMDVKAFLAGLDKVQNRGHGKKTIRCLALSGWRLSGVLRLKWSQIDFATGQYTVTPYDVGWKGFVGQMAINEQFLACLIARRERGGEAESEYVFPSYRGKTPYMRNIYGSMKTASSGMGWRVKPHDLRRTFSTIADVVLNGNQRLIGLLIAHSQPNAKGEQAGSNITGKYMIRNLPAERESARQVASAILQIGGAEPMTKELVAKFNERGIDITKPLELAEFPDDDEAGEDSDGVGPEEDDDEAEVAALAAAKALIRAAKAKAKAKTKKAQ